MTQAIITIARVVLDDDSGDMPDEHNEGFWPSHDLDAAGYVTPDKFEEEQAKAERRMQDFRSGVWGFVGIVARAHIRVPCGQDWITTTIDSPGLWSIESDSGEDYLAEVFEEERQTLCGMLESLRHFTKEG